MILVEYKYLKESCLRFNLGNRTRYTLLHGSVLPLIIISGIYNRMGVLYMNYYLLIVVPARYIIRVFDQSERNKFVSLRVRVILVEQEVLACC